MIEILYVLFILTFVFFVFILDFSDRHKIEPLYRKQRIIELTTAGGKKYMLFNSNIKY